jgi:hypothetical protein
LYLPLSSHVKVEFTRNFFAFLFRASSFWQIHSNVCSCRRASSLNKFQTGHLMFTKIWFWKKVQFKNHLSWKTKISSFDLHRISFENLQFIISLLPVFCLKKNLENKLGNQPTRNQTIISQIFTFCLFNDKLILHFKAGHHVSKVF